MTTLETSFWYKVGYDWRKVVLVHCEIIYVAWFIYTVCEDGSLELLCSNGFESADELLAALANDKRYRTF